MCELFAMIEPSAIKRLRLEMGLTLAEFGARIGLSSKGQVSIIERENRCGLRVALAIETLSDNRIDAGDLCEEVRLARASAHAADPIAAQHGASSGKSGDFAGSQESEAA